MRNFFTKKNKKFFLRNGYLLLSNILDISITQKIKEKVLEQEKYEKKMNASHFYKFDKSLNTVRIWNLVSKDKVFRDIIMLPIIHNFMEWIFDRKTNHQKYILSSFQANILKPGAIRQKLHVDTPVPEPLPQWPMKANTIWMIDDFTNENGATEILPGSHKKKFKPKKKDENNKKIIKCCGKAGSILITHGALWHRAGANVSNMNRIGLLGSFAASYTKEIACEEEQSIIVDKFTVKKSSKKLKKILGLEHGLKIGSQCFRKNRN